MKCVERIPDWIWLALLLLLVVGLGLTAAILFPGIAYSSTTGPTNRWFAEGNTLPNFDTYYCIQNPGGEQAAVEFTFQLEDGSTIARTVPVLPHSRSTVDLKALVPPCHSGVSAHVHCGQPVVVERPMYFTYKEKWTGGSTSCGQASLQTSFYFAEGTTRDNTADGTFETWLCLQNPGGSTANVKVSYLLTTGQTVNKAYTVGPHSRRTVEVAADIGLDQDAGIIVSSSLPIACERPMYYDYHNKVEDGSSVVGAAAPATSWYFAEGTTRPGFDEWLTVLNPGDSQAQVTVRYLLAGGGLNPQVMFVEPRSRKTINVNYEAGSGLDLSAVVTSDVPVVAERSTYADGTGGCYGGDSAMGTVEPATNVEFAEGTTLTGFTTYYTLLNPNPSVVTGTLTYQFKDGSQQQRQLALPASSRTTINIEADVGEGRDVAGSITANLPIVAERPIYFLGRWRGMTVGTGVAE